MPLGLCGGGRQECPGRFWGRAVKITVRPQYSRLPGVLTPVFPVTEGVLLISWGNCGRRLGGLDVPRVLGLMPRYGL